jgi:predicted SnoaL-like aldol condensation-catalyzing enzyme
MDSAIFSHVKIVVVEINRLSISLNIFDTPDFLGEILENITLFMIPENDVNKTRKRISVEIFNLIGSGKPKDILRYFHPECKTHNPYTQGGMNELTDAMIEVQKQAAEGIIKGSKADFKLIIKQVLAEEDMVAVYTQIASSKPSEGGLRQVHLFRFSADKIVEYWDITQIIPEKAPNAVGAFS